MQRSLYIAVGLITIAVGAAVLTEATVAWSDRGRLLDGVGVLTKPSVSPTPKPSVSVASPSVSPTPVATATPTPAPTAVTNDFVHLRGGASTSYPIVENLNAGTAVTLGSYVDSQWQEVTVAGVHGYIYKTYLNY